MSSSRRILTLAALFGAFASLAQVAQAQVYKCPRPDGSVSYQGSPCPSHGKLPPPAPAAPAPAPAPAAPHAVYDPYAPQNASTRPTIVPPPLPRAPVERAPQVTPVAAPRPADVQRTQATDALRQEVERIKAQDKAQRCAQARDQVGVNKEERPIYHYDKDGNKVYVADADRARSLAAAQQRVAQECN